MLHVDKCRDMDKLINFWARYLAPVAAARRSFKMVLFTVSRGNTFVGGKRALPSALLVLFLSICEQDNWRPRLRIKTKHMVEIIKFWRWFKCLNLNVDPDLGSFSHFY